MCHSCLRGVVLIVIGKVDEIVWDQLYAFVRERSIRHAYNKNILR